MLAILGAIILATPLHRLSVLDKGFLFALMALSVLGHFWEPLSIWSLPPLALNCKPDSRTSEAMTSFGLLPQYLLFVSNADEVVTKTGEQPQYDISDGAEYQLSEVDFLRCSVTNIGGQGLSNLSVGFQWTFVRVSGTLQMGQTRPLIPIAQKTINVSADVVGPDGGTFDFGIANFGRDRAEIRLWNIEADGAKGLLRKTHLKDITATFAATGLVLDPQQRKKAPWIFPPAGCSAGFPINGRMPNAQDMRALVEEIKRLSQRPECAQFIRLQKRAMMKHSSSH